jgi:hypothetical protein
MTSGKRTIASLGLATSTAFGLLALVPACDDQQSAQHVCSLVACSSGVFGTLRSESGDLADGHYTVNLTSGSSASECAFDIPEDLPSYGTVTPVECGAGAEMQLGRQTDCDDESCFEIPNKWSLEFRVDDQPEHLGVRVMRNDVLLLESEPTLDYAQFFPNGPECGPVCDQADVELAFENRSDVVISGDAGADPPDGG